MSKVKQNLLTVVLSVSSILILVFLYQVRFAFLGTLIGVGLGVLLSPFMTLLKERFRIPRAGSAIILLFLIAGVLAGSILGIYTLVSGQMEMLFKSAPEIAANVQQRANALLGANPWLQEQLQGQWEKLQLGEITQNSLTYLFTGITATVASVAGFFVVIAVGLYTALNSRSYFNGLLSLFPAHRRQRVAIVLSASASTLRRWFLAQLVAVSITGTLVTLGLWFLGIEYWLVLGFLTALFSFIPYVGAFLTGFLTLLVTLGSSPEMFWWVLLLYVLVQQIEGDIVIPLVMRGGVQLPEVHLIFLMLALGSMFGIIGAFIAPPLLAVGRRIFLMTYVQKMDQQVVEPAENKSQTGIATIGNPVTHPSP